jgi:two-component system chemotaxis sensor kinase CheA
MEVAEELMNLFRGAAMERLERIDAGWHALIRGQADDTTERDLLRDVHTLKGDAKVVGRTEAAMLCQRLEDLLEGAKVRGYRVHDDVDVVVTMTIQFIGMLVRKQSSARRGIDLDGFLKQIEQVMSEWLRRSSEPSSRLSVGPHLQVKNRERLSTASSDQLASSTTAVFAEHLRATGELKERLGTIWRSLLGGLLGAHSAPLAPIIVGHETTVHQLAADLGKRVQIEISGENTSVTPETSSVVGTILVHALRNAIDHGIETPDARTASGKTPEGRIAIRITRDAETITLVITDDGAGVDIERTRKLAVSRGVLSPDLASLATTEQVIEVLYTPGFSTREASTDVSGRGIGLDAAHAAVKDHGGTLTIKTDPGRGTTMTAILPDIHGTIPILRFGSEGDGPRFCVPHSFSVRRVDTEPTCSFERLLDLPEPSAQTFEITDGRTRIVARVLGPATHCRAFRKCPTPNTDAIEVVWVNGEELVLVRPDVVAKPKV